MTGLTGTHLDLGLDYGPRTMDRLRLLAAPVHVPTPVGMGRWPSVRPQVLAAGG